ncbi:MAG: lipid A deacylase LpxR family protein [Gammaproteobacteria bacterium]|nr:lipid A deacylase LpxR family protein [Gammaproteobacteria bacterium]
MLYRLCYLLALLGIAVAPLKADESNWFAVTIDNDLLVGNDDGYTNGIYFSWFEVGDQNERHLPHWLAAPLSWSLDMESVKTSLQAYSVGQTMVTPEDITIENPPINEIPYSGALLFNYTYIAVEEAHADSVGTVIGVVGPSSGAEATQTWFHDLIGANEPEGWDTQLQDEIVFQLSRARLWRSWSASDDRMDLLVLGDAGLGTLSSYVASAMLFRFGDDLHRTFATPLLINTRSANPAAIEGGWYLFAGVRFEYVFNAIYIDGNTFRDSRSIDYDQSQIGLTTGLAYSWENVSITFALYESNISDEATRDITRFGTLTIGWRY